MNTNQINKSVELLNDYATPELIVAELRSLEKENLLKNAYIVELQRRRQSCYDKDGNIDQEGFKEFLSYLEKDIDGMNQGIGELSNLSSTVNIVCEHLNTLKL